MEKSEKEICEVCGHPVNNEDETGYKEHHHVCDICGEYFFYEDEYLKDRVKHEFEEESEMAEEIEEGGQ